MIRLIQPLCLSIALGCSLFFNGIGHSPGLLLPVTAFVLIALYISVERRWLKNGGNIEVGLVPSLFIAFFLICLASPAISIWPQISSQTIWTVVPIALSALTFYWSPDPQQLWGNTLKLILIITLPYIAMGGYQFIWLEVEYATVGFIDTNVFAALCNFCLIVLITWNLQKTSISTRHRIAQYALIFVVSFVLFSTKSRGAFLALGISLFILLCIAFPVIRLKAGSTIKHLSAMTAICVASATTAISMSGNPVDSWNVSAVDPRILLYKTALTIFLENPLFGAGLGTFKSIYPLYRSTLETPTGGDLIHNDYLQFAVEGGIPLLASILSIGLLLLLNLKRFHTDLKKEPGSADNLSLLGAQVGTLALFIHANFNFILYVTALNLLAGISIGAAAKKHFPSTKTLSLSNDIRQPARLSLATFTILLALWAPTLDYLIYKELVIKNKDDSSWLTDNHSRTKFVNLMSVLRPKNLLPLEYQAKQYELVAAQTDDESVKKEYFQLSYANYIKQLDACMINGYATFHLAKLLREHGDQITRQDNYTVLELAQLSAGYRPYQSFGYLLLADLLMEEGKAEEALLTIEESIQYFGWSTMTNQDRIRLLDRAYELAKHIGDIESARKYQEASTIIKKETADFTVQE